MIYFMNKNLIIGVFTLMAFVSSHAANDSVALKQLLGEERALHPVLNALRLIRDGGDVPYTLKFYKSPSLFAPRDYRVTMNDAEKNDLHYILDVLGNDSIVSIGFKKGYIKDVGSSIAHIHPLQILIEMLNDPVNNLNLHKIRQRPSLWEALLSDYVYLLDDENLSKNVLPYIDEFSYQLDIDPASILASVEQGNWMEFIELLLAQVSPKMGMPEPMTFHLDGVLYYHF